MLVCWLCFLASSAQDIELLTNAVEKERKNVERGVGGRERKQASGSSF